MRSEDTPSVAAAPSADQQHSMDLAAFARLAGRGEQPRREHAPIVISAALADALDALLDAADDVAAVAGPLADALADVRRLHDYRAVRLGGEQR